MSSDHAPAVASHEKGCSFKPQGSVVATMKNPFCLDAQIRRREQLYELTEQLESAVRRYYATGRLQDHYEIKFDDGDLADLPLPPEDYGDANMEDGWVLIDEAEI